MVSVPKNDNVSVRSWVLSASCTKATADAKECTEPSLVCLAMLEATLPTPADNIL